MPSTQRSVKICLLGDIAVGKTSLVRRFVYNRFDDKYLSTIGVRVSRKTIMVPRAPDVVQLIIMLWDLAGSEEFDRVRASYLRGAHGALLVCDLTRPDTLERLREYMDQARTSNAAVQMMLLGNKSDLIDEQRVSLECLGDVANSLALPWHLTSAKTGEGVEEAFRDLGRRLVG